MVHDGLRVPVLLLGSQDSCTTGSCSAQSAALLALGSIDGARGLTIENTHVAAFLNHALLQPPPATPLVPVGAYQEALAPCGQS